MPTRVNRQVLLNAHPVGFPVDTDFKMVETPVPEPGDGELLIRTTYLSLDPYMRGRMNPGPSYAVGVNLGDVMGAGTVGQVVASRHDRFAEGDFVLSSNGWQDYAVSDGQGVHTLDPATAPISTAVGVLGMPGMTAYVGLLDVGELKSGDHVVVSAASGAVGAVVAQIAKIKGCRVVGVAGGPEKCAYVVNELGFDACIDHRADDFEAQLAAACPDGIDIYFENVAGRVLEAVIPLFNFWARMPVCGLIAQYSMTDLPTGTNKLPALMRAVLTCRLHIEGFIVRDFADMQADFRRDMGQWVRDGKVKYKEHRVAGLENAPTTLMGLLKGENFGKVVIEVSNDPTA